MPNAQDVNTNNAAPASTPRICVSVVDDSLVARRVLSRILEEDGRFAVTGCYSSADEAIAALSTQRCDLILLDVEMPGRGGVESMPDLIRASSGAMVVILSGHHAEGGSVAIEALANGARDVMTKPTAGHFNPAFASALADRLQAIFTGQDKVAWSGAEPARRVSALPGLSCPPRAVGIGASTGGIHALTAFFNAFGNTRTAPIFVTQHLPADFLPFFAEQLGRQTRLPVHIAADSMPVIAGNVYVAPGNAHLAVTRTPARTIEIRHSHARSRHGAFPAVDPMFVSLAEVYGSGACALVFSGMGRDGLTGAESIVCAGGSVIAQDRATSTVWGMPRAVSEAGLACLTVPPDQAAQILCDSWRAAA